jgi:hypothetical protein
MKPLRVALAIAAVLAPAAARADDDVYCANSRIEMDSRDPHQMRIARGSGVCQMGPTSGFLSSAQDFARNDFGGPDRPCSCQ